MKAVFRVILFPLALVRLILILAASLFFLFTVHIESLLCKKGKAFKFWSLKNWGTTMLLIIGVVVRANKMPITTNYIVMPNHRSYIDIFVMAKLAPASFVAKEEMRKWPIIGSAVNAGRGITVKRNDMKSMIQTMRKIKANMEAGMVVLLYPEGTTYEGPGTKAFKNGSFKIAVDLGSAIIPCAIEYNNKADAWVGDDTFVGHFFRQMWKPVTRVQVQFGNPIQSHDQSELKEKTKAAIDTMLANLQA